LISLYCPAGIGGFGENLGGSNDLKEKRRKKAIGMWGGWIENNLVGNGNQLYVHAFGEGSTVR
jgi:hypothetical protein